MENNETVLNYLNSVYQNTCTALQSINDLMNSVTCENLKAELEREYKEYQVVSDKCEKFAFENHLDISDNNWFEKAKLWGSIKMTTIGDKSPRHIGEMMIIGTVMGMVKCYNDKCQYENVSRDVDKFLRELCLIEENNFDELQLYLKECK